MDEWDEEKRKDDERDDEENGKGIIIACGNTHLFLEHKTVAELLEGLNKNSYELFKTRSEMFQ